MVFWVITYFFCIILHIFNSCAEFALSILLHLFMSNKINNKIPWYYFCLSMYVFLLCFQDRAQRTVVVPMTVRTAHVIKVVQTVVNAVNRLVYVDVMFLHTKNRRETFCWQDCTMKYLVKKQLIWMYALQSDTGLDMAMT